MLLYKLFIKFAPSTILRKRDMGSRGRSGDVSWSSVLEPSAIQWSQKVKIDLLDLITHSRRVLHLDYIQATEPKIH